MKSWMFKYPYGSNTHYEELLKDLDEPTNYQKTYEIFNKARFQFLDEKIDYDNEERKKKLRQMRILGLPKEKK